MKIQTSLYIIASHTLPLVSENIINIISVVSLEIRGFLSVNGRYIPFMTLIDLCSSFAFYSCRKVKVAI